MSWGYQPYVSVAKRRANAAKKVKQLLKSGKAVSPVVIEGRRIAASFWGKAWCDNLERYSDFSNRLPRGRTYVRNGSVIDLSIAQGAVEALVSGSEIYKVRIDIAMATPQSWGAICADCTGSVGSVVELLQGKLSRKVMDRVCREGDGLFPAVREIEMACTCPDWADMCKHVAAVLYGIGARLDADPDALFILRGVDRNELIALAADPSITQTAASNENVLADDDMAALFGIELEMPQPCADIIPEKAKMPKPRSEKITRTTKRAQGAGDEGKLPRRAARSGKKKGDPLPTEAQEATKLIELSDSSPFDTPLADAQGNEGQVVAKTDAKAPSRKVRKSASYVGERPVRLSVRKELAEASGRGRRSRRP